METRRPRASINAPIEAAANPLPNDETTPPVTKINLVFIFFPPGGAPYPGDRYNQGSLHRKARNENPNLSPDPISPGQRYPLLWPVSGTQASPDSRQVFGGIDPLRSQAGFGNPDFIAMFQHPKLLEFFLLFERRFSHVRIIQQKLAPVDIQPDMLGHRQIGPAGIELVTWSRG